MEENLTAESLASDVIEQAKYQVKLWFVAFLITLAALVGTNTYWIYVFQSYEYVSQDGDGINNYRTNNSGEIINHGSKD